MTRWSFLSAFLLIYSQLCLAQQPANNSEAAVPAALTYEQHNQAAIRINDLAGRIQSEADASAVVSEIAGLFTKELPPAWSLPREGGDEWYIFGRPTDLGTSHLGDNPFKVPQEHGHVSVLVNYCFALHSPEMKDLATVFWQQMDWIRPESYMSDNDYLTFVSMNKILFASVRDAVKPLS